MRARLRPDGTGLDVVRVPVSLLRRAAVVPRRLRRYVLTAGGAAVADLGAFAVLTAAGVSVLTAATLSFLFANLVNYRLSAGYAFGSTPTLRLYPRFLAASGIGLAINVAVTWAAAQGFGPVPGAPALLAKIAGMGVAFAVNFGLNTAVVFPRRRMP